MSYFNTHNFVLEMQLKLLLKVTAECVISMHALGMHYITWYLSLHVHMSSTPLTI